MKVFILGTGRSLRTVNLDLLKGQFSIACNRINLLYDKFEWRPDVYVYEDPKGNPYRETDMLLHLEEGYPCWYATDTLPWLPHWWNWSNLHIFHRCGHAIENPTYGWHLPHLCGQGGPVYTSIQLAVRDYEATEIVLLGCDGHYEKGYDSHLSPNYDTKMVNRSVAKRLNNMLAWAHEISEKECKKRGVKIYNATAGSAIGAHEKVELEKML